MADAVVERERELGRRFLVAERVAGRGGHGGMIEAVALGEKRQQFRGRMRQHGRERFDPLPLRVGQRSRRQDAQTREVAQPAHR